MVKTNRSPATFGLEYDYEILHYKVIDEPLFFLSVLKLDIEFDVVSKESRAAVHRFNEKVVDKTLLAPSKFFSEHRNRKKKEKKN